MTAGNKTSSSSSSTPSSESEMHPTHKQQVSSDSSENVEVVHQDLKNMFSHGEEKLLRKNIRKTQIRKFHSDTLLCSDIVFAMMTKNINSISEIVYNFTRETKLLNTFV